METVFSEPSYRLESDRVTAFVTAAGAHLGPVTFRLDGLEVTPFSVAPWAGEPDAVGLPPILRVLRGDFFCLPFGEASPAPIHGHPANDGWEVLDEKPHHLELALTVPFPNGRVRRTVAIHPHEAAIYHEAWLTGFDGQVCFGTHPMLRFSSPGVVSLAPYAFGLTFPGEFESPAAGGACALGPGVRLARLEEVPTRAGDVTDLTRFPAREGFDDLVMVATQPGTELGWTAVAFPEEGWFWIALRDARVLTATMLWFSNRGRHYAPWNGRHGPVMGLEDLTAYFNLGLEASRTPNPISDAGVPTSRLLGPHDSLSVRTIQAVHRLPGKEGRISRVTPVSGGVEVAFLDGSMAIVPLNADYVFGG